MIGRVSRLQRHRHDLYAIGALDKAEEVLLRARRAGSDAGAIPPESHRSISASCTWPKGRGRPWTPCRKHPDCPQPGAHRRRARFIYHDIGTAQKDLGDSTKALESFGLSLEANLAKLLEMAAADYYMIASVYSREGRTTRRQRTPGSPSTWTSRSKARRVSPRTCMRWD